MSKDPLSLLIMIQLAQKVTSASSGFQIRLQWSDGSDLPKFTRFHQAKDDGFCWMFHSQSFHNTLWFWLTVRHGIDDLFIDGLPNLIAWWIFPWRTVSHNQMVISLGDLHKMSQGQPNFPHWEIRMLAKISQWCSIHRWDGLSHLWVGKLSSVNLRCEPATTPPVDICWDDPSSNHWVSCWIPLDTITVYYSY